MAGISMYFRSVSEHYSAVQLSERMHVGQHTHKTVIALDLLLLCRLHPRCWKTMPADLLLLDTAA